MKNKHLLLASSTYATFLFFCKLGIKMKQISLAVFILLLSTTLRAETKPSFLLGISGHSGGEEIIKIRRGNGDIDTISAGDGAGFYFGISANVDERLSVRGTYSMLSTEEDVNGLTFTLERKPLDIMIYKSVSVNKKHLLGAGVSIDTVTFKVASSRGSGQISAKGKGVALAYEYQSAFNERSNIGYSIGLKYINIKHTVEDSNNEADASNFGVSAGLLF